MKEGDRNRQVDREKDMDQMEVVVYYLARPMIVHLAAGVCNRSDIDIPLICSSQPTELYQWSLGLNEEYESMNGTQ
jgi:hypothetical protein